MNISLSDDELDRLADAIADRLIEMRLGRPDQESPYLSVEEAARYLRASRQHVDDLLSARRLPRVKDGRRTLIARVDLERHLRKEKP